MTWTVLLKRLNRTDRAVAIWPDYATAWFNRGIALNRAGRNEEAIGSYDRALALDPDDAGIWLNRGSCTGCNRTAR